MDLAAAVSDADSNVPGSANYIVQFNNQGEYVFKRTGLNTAAISQWDFWCNGSNLDQCSTDEARHPFDTQISYNAQGGHWIVSALSDNGVAQGQDVYVGASTNANPAGTFYLYALAACTMYSNPTGGSGYPHDLADHPIMGTSHGANGIHGRVVIDVQCWNTDSSGNLTNYDKDEIIDIDVATLETGGSIGGGNSCAGSSCTEVSSSPGNTLPPFLRPANNYGTTNKIMLSSVNVNSAAEPVVTVYKLLPGSTVSSDLFQQVGTFVGPISIYNGLSPNPFEVLAPQPGCSLASDCAVSTETLRNDDGAIQTSSITGYDIYTTSFPALAQNQTDSYYFAFVLNNYSQAYTFVYKKVTNGTIGFTSATLDPDQEIAVNYTSFTSSGSNSSIDLINANPISSASIVWSSGSISNSTAKLPGFSCEAQDCRWGDYTAEVFDPTCVAVETGLASECGLFWSTVEWTDGANLNSQLVAISDPVETNDTGQISFIGSQNAETDCSTSPCSVTFNAPAGTQPGDLLLVAMSSTGAIGLLPSMPAGWNAINFQNTGSASFASSDSAGIEESGWLITHVYQSSDSGSYTFSEQNSPGSEVGGLILAYRGVDPDYSATLSAWGFGNGATDPACQSPGDQTSVTLPQIAVPAYNQLVTVFKVFNDEICFQNSCTEPANLAYSNFSGSPGLNVETPTSFTGDTWDGFAADIWNGNTQNFGPYTATGAVYEGYPVCALPLSWAVALPSGLP